MTDPDRGTVGLNGARTALAARSAVVLPNPAPLTSVVAATDPTVVNTAKHRPPAQPVALWAHHPDTWTFIADVLDLTEDRAAFARRLLVDELLTVLLPLRDAHLPVWLAPASKDGWTLLFGTRWLPLRPLLTPFPVLYVSSANTTGHKPAATAAEALTMFDENTPVLGTADLRTPHDPAPRQATTTIRLHPGGRLDIHRNGAQDRAHDNAAAYLSHLRSLV
jgi:L-threonylcarbamoyladenylate synthase